MRPPHPGCAPYPGSTNRHGEVEKLDACEVSHWFVEVARCRYHFVTAGDPRFSHLEKPAELTNAIRRFLVEQADGGDPP